MPLLIPALAAVAARPLAARLEPRRATWLLTAAAVTLAGCSTAALALLAAAAATRTPVLASLGRYSPAALRRAVVLAHERAHLSGRHHLFTTAAQLAAAANPLLIPLARAVGYTAERWADKHAARATGDRRLVAATIARVALLTPPRPRRAAAAVLGITPPRRRVSLARAGPVPRRVAALLAPSPARHTVLLAAVAAITALAGLSVLEAARDLHALLELALAR